MYGSGDIVIGGDGGIGGGGGDDCDQNSKL